MFGFRTKRVTDPLDDRAKARIVGMDRVEPSYYSSSGSEHSADVAHSSLSEELVFFGFSDSEGGDLSTTTEISEGYDSERDRSSIGDSSAGNADAIEQIVAVDATDEFRNVLEDHVSNAMSAFFGAKPDKRIVRRSVMAYLRNRGYNAAVCKTKWENSGGITAGSHEFVDVLSEGDTGARYFVDLEFASEFEIARPTSSYERLLRSLPTVFVGKSEDLKRILKAVSGAARRSLRSVGLHVPPWRKHRFMQNKWLGSHRRSTSLIPSSTSYRVVECRAEGFDAAGCGSRLVSAAAACTT